MVEWTSHPTSPTPRPPRSTFFSIPRRPPGISPARAATSSRAPPVDETIFDSSIQPRAGSRYSTILRPPLRTGSPEVRQDLGRRECHEGPQWQILCHPPRPFLSPFFCPPQASVDVFTTDHDKQRRLRDFRLSLVLLTSLVTEAPETQRRQERQLVALRRRDKQLCDYTGLEILSSRLAHTSRQIL